MLSRIQKKSEARVRKVHLRTLCCWKAATEYANPETTPFSMEMYYHRNIQSTLLTPQLIDYQRDRCHSAIATMVYRKLKGSMKRVERVCDFDGAKVLRRRKQTTFKWGP